VVKAIIITKVFALNISHLLIADFLLVLLELEPKKAKQSSILSLNSLVLSGHQAEVNNLIEFEIKLTFFFKGIRMRLEPF
jgi:hypothetical protein